MKESIKTIIKDVIGKRNIQNPIKSVEIITSLHIRRSEFRDYITGLRRDGVPIASKNGTDEYYICQTAEELQDYIDFLQARAKNYFETITAMKYAKDRLFTEKLFNL